MVFLFAKKKPKSNYKKQPHSTSVHLQRAYQRTTPGERLRLMNANNWKLRSSAPRQWPGSVKQSPDLCPSPAWYTLEINFFLVLLNCIRINRFHLLSEYNNIILFFSLHIKKKTIFFSACVYSMLWSECVFVVRISWQREARIKCITHT